ncbi:MAG TPA: hypothetical protein VFX60_09065 [Micromonospora sp.]|nr:hypothetical protein [Micromonospora sp.]
MVDLATSKKPWPNRVRQTTSTNDPVRAERRNATDRPDARSLAQ